MELLKEIMIQVLMNEDIQISFPGLQPDLSGIVESKCYQALKRIKAIIEDDSLEDSECFMKVEEIVCTLEELGSDGGSRHDFG